MLCEFCNVDQKEFLIFVLPCGFSICYDHIKLQNDSFKCIKCEDHWIDKQHCLNIRKNQEKLKIIHNFEEKQVLLEKYDKLDQLKNDFESIIINHFSKIIIEIDLKRECLKFKLIEDIDNYGMSLINCVKILEVNSINYIRQKLDSFDPQNLRNNLKQQSCSKFDFLCEIDAEIDNGKLNQIIESLENIKQIEFEQIDKQNKLNLSELFGVIKSNSLNENFKQPIQKDEKIANPSAPFKNYRLLGLFDLCKFEELNSGEIIFSSISDSSNFVIINPSTYLICEPPTRKKNISSSKIVFFFKTKNSEIISIKEDHRVEKFQNGIMSPCFQFSKSHILFIDIFESELYILDKNNILTKREYKCGKLLKSFHFINEVIFSMRVFKKDKILTGHDNKVFLWDMTNGKLIKTFKTSGRVLKIEIINDKNFVIGCNDGYLNIWDCESDSRISNKCHDCSIACVQVYQQTHILSLGSKDRKVKIWNAINMNLIFVFNLSEQASIPIFFKLLRNGKLVFMNSNGTAYASELNFQKF